MIKCAKLTCLMNCNRFRFEIRYRGIKQRRGTLMSEKTKDSGLKASVQKLGSYLSSMVMPNIVSFISWGIITALFIPDGWIPNVSLYNLVRPMSDSLLP